MAIPTASPAAPTEFYALQPDGTLPPAPAGMEDVWPKVHAMLVHHRALMADEAAVQAQQRGMIRDGCFLMPSPYPGQADDECTRSWLHEYQLFYEFCSGTGQRYLWVSGQLDRGYALDTIWFPGRNVAVTGFPPSADAGRLGRFRDMLTLTPPKPVWATPADTIPRIVVTGFQHLMHMLWNQLPALDRLAESPLPDSLRIAVQCEPFGPTTSLFPELAHATKPSRLEDVPALNAQYGLVIGLGSWTITPGTQARVRRVAAEQAGPEIAARRDAFKARHHPVFWLSVKPPKRTMSNQAETLAALITALRADYPSAGFIVDGASLPQDFPANGNYPPWFHDVMSSATTGSAEIIAGVLNRLSPEVIDHVVTLNGVSVCEEIVWGEATSFYICHGGTMQNKIGWVHAVPGFIHSNRTFLALFRMMPAPVTLGPPCYYASDAVLIDDDPARYSAHELARKDQDYTFTSIGQVIAEIRTAIAQAGLP